jgi:hypothetical protein
MRGKERFSAPGGLSVPICVLALVAAKKRCPFMVRGSHALYQGMTLVGRTGSTKIWALAPELLPNQLLQSTN